jgi:hypothetical protein
MAQGLGNMAFARSTGTGHEHACFFVNKLAGGQIIELPLVDLGIEVKIKFFQGLAASKSGFSHSGGEFFLISSGHFVT